MKLSTLILGSAILLASSSAVAKIVVFKSLDDNLETKACVLAAKEGVEAAKAMVKSKNINFNQLTSGLTCNGLSLSSFAQKYNQTDSNSDDKKITVKLVVNNTNPASKVCLDALLIGEREARIKHSVLSDEIYCNKQKISNFVQEFSDKNIELVNSAD